MKTGKKGAHRFGLRNARDFGQMFALNPSQHGPQVVVTAVPPQKGLQGSAALSDRRRHKPAE